MRFLLLITLGWALSAAAETDPAAAPPPSPSGRRTVTVLLGNDTSGYNLGSALQYAVAQLFKNVDGVDVQLSTYSLPAFTQDETAKAHHALSSEIFSFAYMDRERISVFLFDRHFPGQFIVAVSALLDPGETQLTTPLLESKLRRAFSETLASYQQKKFQYLPGAGSEKGGDLVAETEEDIAHRKAAEAGHLFRELASQFERPLYVGVNLGMARYSDIEGKFSVVDVGLAAGYHLSHRFAVQTTLDVFSYGLLSIDLRYRVPLGGKYVYLDASGGAGMVLFKVGITSGFTVAPPGIESGKFLFGPGLHFGVPLLGATITGGIRLFLGSGALLMGSYGVSYALAL